MCFHELASSAGAAAAAAGAVDGAARGPRSCQAEGGANAIVLAACGGRAAAAGPCALLCAADQSQARPECRGGRSRRAGPPMTWLSSCAARHFEGRRPCPLPQCRSDQHGAAAADPAAGGAAAFKRAGEQARACPCCLRHCTACTGAHYPSDARRSCRDLLTCRCRSPPAGAVAGGAAATTAAAAATGAAARAGATWCDRGGHSGRPAQPEPRRVRG